MGKSVVFLTFFTFISLTGRGGVGYNGTRENEVRCLDAFTEMLLEELGTPTAFTIPLLGGIEVSQSVVVSWIVMAVLILAAVCLTRNLKVENPGKVQVGLESAVEFLNGFVKTNIGEHWRPFAPWLGTVALYIGFANIIGIFGSMLRRVLETIPSLDHTLGFAWGLIASAVSLSIILAILNFQSFIDISAYTDSSVIIREIIAPLFPSLVNAVKGSANA